MVPSFSSIDLFSSYNYFSLDGTQLSTFYAILHFTKIICPSLPLELQRKFTNLIFFNGLKPAH